MSNRCLPVPQGQALSLDAEWVGQSNSDWEDPFLAHESEKKMKFAQLCPDSLQFHGLSLSSSIHEMLQDKYWSGLTFRSPRDLPIPGIEPRSPALQADSLPTEPLHSPVSALSRVKLTFFSLPANFVLSL